MTHPNQNPEQTARANIDKILRAAGWYVEDKKKINISEGLGIAIREYQIDIGPADIELQEFVADIGRCVQLVASEV